MIKKLLCTLFLVLVQTVVFAATKTYLGSGNWNNTTNWSGGTLPTLLDDVIISSGQTITVTTGAFANNLSVLGTGTLTVNNGITLTVNGNVIVDSGASFNAGTGNNDSATIKVYGDFINQGTANFWKSTVVIAGNLITASTILQNNGNIIVGGNVSGVIGGSGSGIVYPVNPNSTVIVTGSADEKPAGTLPTNSTLLTLMYEVIYGGSCPFTITDIANISTCSGSNAVFTVTTNASSPSYLWQVNTNGSGWVDLTNGASYSGVTSSTLTITGVVIGMNNYKYRAKIAGGSPSCTKNGNYGVLTVNTLLSQPILSSTAIPLDCTSITGTFTITNYNASYTYAVSPSTGVTISGSTVTAPAGSYTLTAALGTCISTSSSSVTISNPITTTWNGTSWSNGIPLGNSNIVFTGSYPPAIDPAIDLSGCSCQITGSPTVTIKSGRTLTVVNGINVPGSASLIFENKASLVQTNNDGLNTGNIIYKRLTTPIKKFDYTYWSSPVSPQTLYNVSPSTLSDKFFSFDSAVEDWKQENSSTIMSKGKGYIIRAPENNDPTPPPPGLHEATFIGTPNNGTVSISSVINDKSYLIGNPYPSALDANKFLTDNSSVLDGTLYFWTHNTSIQLASGITNGSAGSGVYAYTSDDYATYNLTGGAATSATILGLDPVVPTGKIAAGQAFFATTKPTIPANSSIIFNNTMRVSGGVLGINNAQFFRTAKSSKTTNAIEKHRVWLNLTNSEGAFKQMLVGYVTDATNDYDDAFDGESFDGNQFVDFYSINDDKNLTIQGRALPFDKNDEVILGYSSTIAGTFSISIDQVDGILTSEDVFIEDKMTNSVKNLKEGAYSFSTGAGAFNDRFVLLFTQKTLGTDNVGEFDNSVLISKDKNELKIKSELESIKRITVFDLLGRKIFDKEAVNSNEFRTSNITLNKQLVVVKVILANGKEISKKVIY
ncbi:MAG: T9SS sorting signal type C domain-containing protein [Bacteroidota bacterium]